MVAAIGAKNSCFFWTLSHKERRKTLDYSYAGHWTSRKHSRTPGKHLGTLQIVSSWGFNAFSSQKNTPNMFCACIHILWHHHTKMMPPSGRAYPQVYCVKFWSKSDWRCPRYSQLYHTPLPEFFPIWPLSANTSETWPQNQHQHHNNSSPSLPRPLQMLLPVCWQLGQPP